MLSPCRRHRRRLAAGAVVTAATLASTAAPAPARADGFAEAVLGLAVPLADDDYADAFDPAFKLGGRFGGGAGAIGFEAGVDFTLGNLEGDDSFGNLEASASRIRLLAGARYRTGVGARATGFFRAGLGADIATFALSGDLLGLPVDSSETDVGLAVELGAGLVVRSGTLLFGGQVALPMGFHADDDDPTDPDDADFEYTSVELDLLLTLGTAF